MKIGILTFHSAYNYGAILQAFALQQYIMSIGHQVEIINYRPEVFDRFYSKNPFVRRRRDNIFIRLIKVALFDSWTFMMYNKRCELFQKDINSLLCLSPSVKDTTDIDNKYDAIIFGSDQIWNFKLTSGPDSFYLGEIQCPLKIGYAISMAKDLLVGDNLKIYDKALNRFNALSFREEFFYNYFASRHPNVEQVIDPTLLIDEQVFDRLITKKPVKGKYILVYQTKYSPVTMQVAEMIRKQFGFKIYVINKYKKPFASYKTINIGPQGFVNWIAHASCIVTTSFHGTALSIVTKRPFYTIAVSKDTDVRSISMLESLNLQGRFTKSIDDINIKESLNIEYSEVIPKLKDIRNKSQLYLKKYLI